MYVNNILLWSQLMRMCVRAKSLQLCLTLRPCGLWPTRLLCPWDSPGRNTRVGCHSLLQGTFLTQGQAQVSWIGRQVHNRWAPGSPFVRLGRYPLWPVAAWPCALLVRGGGRLEGCAVSLCGILWLAGGAAGVHTISPSLQEARGIVLWSWSG